MNKQVSELRENHDKTIQNLNRMIEDQQNHLEAMEDTIEEIISKRVGDAMKAMTRMLKAKGFFSSFFIYLFFFKVMAFSSFHVLLCIVGNF